MSAASPRSQLKDLHPRHNANIYGHSLPRGASSSKNVYTKFFFGIRSFFLSENAIVHPRLKISGKDISFSNLRPVSNLQFISKLAKRAVFNQVHEHVMKFQL